MNFWQCLGAEAKSQAFLDGTGARTSKENLWELELVKTLLITKK